MLFHVWHSFFDDELGYSFEKLTNRFLEVPSTMAVTGDVYLAFSATHHCLGFDLKLIKLNMGDSQRTIYIYIL